mmetsp:Transcript_35705/g.54643  ORF Transcript_35705/g.54643 Transcript_35705/m.54643 type:complete len:190 (-) Transcript_35705:5-574(-)
MCFDFELKLICTFLLHLMVTADMKSALDLIRYLKNPQRMEHINSSRFFCATLLVVKYFVAVATEVFFILTMSRIEEKETIVAGKEFSSSTMVLLTFVIFAVIYEAPNLFFKSRVNLSDAQYATAFWQTNSLQRRERVIDMKVPGMEGELSRAYDIDFWLSLVYLVLNEAYCVVFVYSFFYLVAAAQMFL